MIRRNQEQKIRQVMFFITPEEFDMLQLAAALA
jgi:hypothetical protein